MRLVDDSPVVNEDEAEGEPDHKTVDLERHNRQNQIKQVASQVRLTQIENRVDAHIEIELDHESDHEIESQTLIYPDNLSRNEVLPLLDKVELHEEEDEEEVETNTEHPRESVS